MFLYKDVFVLLIFSQHLFKLKHFSKLEVYDNIKHRRRTKTSLYKNIQFAKMIKPHTSDSPIKRVETIVHKATTQDCTHSELIQYVICNYWSPKYQYTQK